MENAWSTMLDAVRPPTETERRLIERFPRDPAYPFLAPTGFTKDGGVVWQAFKPRYTQHLHAG